MYVKHMLYRTFYAMYVYKHTSFSFCDGGRSDRSIRKWLPPVLSPNVFSQDCLSAVTTQDGCGDMGEQSLFLAQRTPP